MKSYTLPLTLGVELQKQDGFLWRSNVINLYDNEFYRNFSIRRAKVGTDLLGNGIYTGLESEDGIHSEIGYVDGGRFIDTSGLIQLTSWRLNIESHNPYADRPALKLSVYHSQDNPNEQTYANLAPNYTGDWASKTDISEASDIFINNCGRYCYLEIRSESEFDPTLFDINVELYLTIYPPVISGTFESTYAIGSMFPSWMDIHEQRDIFNAAEPNQLQSLGAKVVNAISGEWLDDIVDTLNYNQAQLYIETVDLTQKSYVYRTTRLTDAVISVIGDGVALLQASDAREFSESPQDEDAYYLDSNKSTILCNKKYTELFVNGEVYDQELFQIWNSLDSIGATVDLFRNRLESNESFKARILDVYINKPGPSLESFKMAVRRELDLWSLEGATPDSLYEGATPDVYELEDIKSLEDYFTKEGHAKDKFWMLVNELADKYPLLWGFFEYGKGYWDPDGIKRQGVQSIPKLTDLEHATPIESGVGDLNDLFVFRPEQNFREVEFTSKLKARGKERVIDLEFLPVEVSFDLVGKAQLERYVNPTIDVPFVIEIVLGVDTFFSNILVSTASDVSHENLQPSPESWSTIDWVTSDGFTDAGYQFFSKQTGTVYFYEHEELGPTNQIDLTDPQFTQVSILPGHWNPDTQLYQNIPVSSTYKAWSFDDNATWLGASGAAMIQRTSAQDLPSVLFVESQSFNVETINYETEHFSYSLILNETAPYTSNRSYTFELPGIVWPAHTSSPEIVVSLKHQVDGNYGARLSLAESGFALLPDSCVYVDGNNTWTSGTKSISSLSEEIVFQINDPSLALYPVQVPRWEPFEAETDVVISGTVDHYGPWRYGVKPREKTSNTLLTVLNNLTRADFGIPNSDIYSIYWIGPDSVSSDLVSVWLDSNRVVTSLSEDGEYRVVETLNDQTGQYSFNAIPVHATLKKTPNTKWSPRVHSGTVHIDNETYHLYASPVKVETTETSVVCPGVARQGAPILAYGDGPGGLKPIRMVHLVDSVNGSFAYSQDVVGTGDSEIYLHYSGFNNLTITDLSDEAQVQVISVEDNKVILQGPLVEGRTYRASYYLIEAFQVKSSLDDEYNQSMTVYFDSPPGPEYTKYVVVYESSLYDPATPTDLALNPMETPFSEGYIYIDNKDYDLGSIRLILSPSDIVSGNSDYLIVSINTFDTNGNPKPNQTVTLSASYGSIITPTIVTDENGFAVTKLVSQPWAQDLSVIATTPPINPPSIENGFTASVHAQSGSIYTISTFVVDIKKQKGKEIVAVMEADSILAEGYDATSIFGKVFDENKNPVANQDLYWRKGRSVFDVFQKGYLSSQDYNLDAGMVTTDANGRFTIGPFVSDPTPGYFFVAIEDTLGEYGDIVFWCEYPNINDSVDIITNVGRESYQDATPTHTLPNYSFGSLFPVSLDEVALLNPLESATPDWVPPSWYVIDRYRQYQMGLYGQDYYQPGATPDHPDYTEY